jgi:hypothetical protein
MKSGDRSSYLKLVLEAHRSKLVPSVRRIWLWRPVLGLSQPLPHANVCRQSGPQHSPGCDSYDKKPPDHPHEVKDIKLWSAAGLGMALLHGKRAGHDQVDSQARRSLRDFGSAKFVHCQYLAGVVGMLPLDPVLENRCVVRKIRGGAAVYVIRTLAIRHRARHPLCLQSIPTLLEFLLKLLFAEHIRSVSLCHSFSLPHAWGRNEMFLSDLLRDSSGRLITLALPARVLLVHPMLPIELHKVPELLLGVRGIVPQ